MDSKYTNKYPVFFLGGQERLTLKSLEGTAIGNLFEKMVGPGATP
jgi:hypothetical protein